MALSPALSWQAFQLSKQGNAVTDYEDASAGDPRRGRFAIADGATEASFAGVWAQLLVERFVADPGKPWREFDWIEAARQQWAADIDRLPLPWYAEEKRDQGAFATFLGLTIRRREGGPHGYWRAVAVGDCCLFHMRGGELTQACPLTRSAEFGNQPQLLCSRSAGSAASKFRAFHGHGRWQTKDRFLLMTDALAHWFLVRIEQKGNPLAEINRLLQETSPAAAFASWIDFRRRQSLLRNDDVTLIIVDVE
jgi:hypothetical protein